MHYTFFRIPVPMKSFKITSLNTDVEGSPPPPPAPADPSVEAANAAVAAAAAAAAAEGSAHQYGDLYPTYNTYLMNRYSDQRYHTPSYTTSGYSTASHISAHATSGGESYYRYPDYSRYPYSGGNPSGPTSPRWRRRSYDPEYISSSRRVTTGSGSGGSNTSNTSVSRPLSDLASSMGNATSTPTSSVLMRSRSRSRVSSEYDPNAYLRYMSPAATSTYSTPTRPMSSYIYGHSYNPSTTIHNDPGVTGGNRMGSAPPQPPPNYNAMDREVSARVRRYQTDPNS